MKRSFSLFALFLLCHLIATAQSAIGTWRSHGSYHNATQCVSVEGKIYVLSDGALYSYTAEDEYVECYDKTNILSDQGIRHIAVDELTNTLVIIYNNANIDLVSADGSVRNITDYTNKLTLDPTVNDVNIVQGNAYLSTNFGITILNIARGEFVSTYALGKITNSSLFYNGHIYAATVDGIYCGDTNDNLLDTSSWMLINKTSFRRLSLFDDTLTALGTDKSIYSINTTDGTAILFRKGPFTFMHTVKKELIIGNGTNVYIYDTAPTPLHLRFDGSITYCTTDGASYWTTNGKRGLNGYAYNNKEKTTDRVVGDIIPNSPIRNHCQYLNFADDNRLLVAGGCLNYFGETLFSGTLMMYEEGTWTSFQEEGIAQQTGVAYNNMTSIVQDPTDPNHHYASSFGQGIYEFRDMKLVHHITDRNSELESAIPGTKNYIRISRLQYDKEGNLWITSADGESEPGHKYNNVDSPLKLLKPEGTIVPLYYKELENQATITEVLFANNGWLWVVGMRADAALFCIDPNGTLENTSDDRIRTFNAKFTDQDGQSTEVFYINDIAEDANNDLWVMTDAGPYVLFNTQKAFHADYHFNKIKVPRNDGTNYADYLLNGVYTTCIEIDAANRKWIGTLNNGLYLITGDGLETIHHFTKDNSPLPSNTIESLAINHASGELFIGTDRGLISYTTDATRSETQYTEEKVYAYPNPVNPDYDGLITIVGLKVNSNVKITNTAGRLVAEGTSLGGTFTWNGRTAQGQRVATGIYYVLGTDEEGREGIVTKILFIQ
jgi:hypothetical protein